MLSISAFGMFHTIISLAAVVCGVLSLLKIGAIRTHTLLGGSYISLTAASCVTGLFIFHHGGFGPPHALALLTLVVLLIGLIAGWRPSTSGKRRYVEIVTYSLTLFFHMIPGMTETFTRLPHSSPLFTGPDDPALRTTIGCFFIVFLIGATLQVRNLRRARTSV